MNYFTLEEFQCKCKNKQCPGKLPHFQGTMNVTLLQALNRIRQEFGKPIIVTSGYRCNEHNVAIGGAPQSQHRRGTAADIKPKDEAPGELDRLFEVCKAEKEIVGLGDGRDKGFIHVDCRPGKVRKQWDYTPSK